MTQYLCLKSVDECILPQTDIENMQVWCNANFVKLNSCKTMVMAFIGKTNIHHHPDKLWDPSVSRTDNIKDSIENCISIRICRLHFLETRKDAGLNQLQSISFLPLIVYQYFT